MLAAGGAAASSARVEAPEPQARSSSWGAEWTGRRSTSAFAVVARVERHHQVVASCAAIKCLRRAHWLPPFWSA